MNFTSFAAIVSTLYSLLQHNRYLHTRFVLALNLHYTSGIPALLISTSLHLVIFCTSCSPRLVLLSMSCIFAPVGHNCFGATRALLALVRLSYTNMSGAFFGSPLALLAFISFISASSFLIACNASPSDPSISLDL